jgi:selenocysteine-specific elongation factor
VVDELVKQKTVGIKAGYLFQLEDWQEKKNETRRIIDHEHQKNPLKRGITGTALQVKIGLPREILTTMVEEMLTDGIIYRDGEWLAISGYKPGLSSQQQAAEGQIMSLFKAAPFAPPTLKELLRQFPGNEDVIYFLMDKGELVQFADGILLEKITYNKIKSEVTAFLKANGQLAIQDMNKLFGLTRKYTIPVLGQLDKEKVTKREGDVRVLG